MKFTYLLFLSLLFSCGSSKEKSETNIGSDAVGDMLNYLASDELQGRKAGSDGIEKAAAYIEGKFKSYGVAPYFETYRDNFEAKNVNAFNVIGVIPGSDPKLKNEILLIGAHYDHIGQAVEIDGDKLANGANDNAAGTVAVLQMAKHFATKKTNKRTILFALFSAEEMGLLGSKHLAEKMKAKKVDLYAMVNFEMIGVPMQDKTYLAYLTGYETSNMSDKINEYSGFEMTGLLPKAKEYQLFRRSDNYPFYQAFKVPAQTISTFDFTNYSYYHHVNDEASELDVAHMQAIITKIIPALERMTTSASKEIELKKQKI